MRNALQRGAALIMALLVVAIVSAISIALMTGEQIAINRIEFTLNADQAALDMQYSTPWILSRLEQLNKDFQENATLPTWPQTFTTTLADNSQLKLQFSPAGMRFNLNNLASPVSNYTLMFTNLLQMADENLSADQIKTILQNIQSELFATNKMNTRGLSYIISPSQLRLVDGITPKIYQALIPYLIALPSSNTPININAAPEFVLAALLDKDHTAAAAALAYRKQNNAFANTSLFLGLPAVVPYAAAMQYLGQIINVQGDKYYLAHITITRDHLQYQWYSILQFVANSQAITTLYVGSSL